ncbi:MAG: biotin/lipoyl-binding protein, partial [Duncaniella sp.]|nr:biotin/lipoyl-binding protein [Duncaniella sp.]
MKKTYILSSVLTVAATLTACHGSHNSSDSDGEMPVDVAEATVDSVVLHKTYPGSLAALEQVEIVGRASGQLTGTYFNGGDHVAKGQVLFTIEDTKYRDAVTQAQAQL